MKRILRSLIMIVVIVIFSMQSNSLIFAQGLGEEPKINMKVDVGFDGYYKLGYYTPFYFEIDNKLKDINGELQVEIPDETDNLTLYTMQINLPNNSTKKFMMNIPMSRFTSKLQVNIVEGKNKVFTKAIQIKTGTNIETLGIGILSDDYESVKYINKIPTSNNNQFTTKTVKLTEDMLSDSVDILKNFNVIVINNYDTSKLSKEKYEALKAWVSDGGMLLLGTGPSYTKTLAAFKDDFITGEIGDVAEVSTNQLYSIAQGGTVSDSMTLSVLKLDLKDSKPIVEEGATPLIVKLEKGSGSVAVAAFDFGLEPLASWVGRTSFSEKLMQKMLPSLYANPYMNKDFNMINNMYSMDNSLRNIPELPKAKTTNLLIVLFAYIILVAPLSYIILKKLDKREWMWLTVPIISLVFAAVIYVSGFGTRMNEPIVNIINIVELGANGTGEPRSYAGVFTPNKSDIRVEAADGLSIKPIVTNMNVYYGTINPQDEKKIRQVVTKITVAPRTIIEFYKTSIWSMKTLVLNNKETIRGSFDVNINYSKNAYEGSIANNSSFDLDECYIATSNQIINIGPIKNGETIKLEGKKGKYYTQPYEMIHTIYPDPNRGRQPGKRLTSKEIEDFRRSFQKRQVMEYTLTSGGQGLKGAKLIGWSNNPLMKDIMVNGKLTKRYEKSLVLSDVKLSFVTGKKVSYPMGYLQPTTTNTLNNGGYDEYGKTFYGRGNVEVQFQIDKEIVPDYIKLQYTVFKGGPSSIKEYIWNFNNSSWEEGSYSTFLMDEAKLAKYVGENNTIKLKFELYDGNLQLPQISVEGSVK